MSGILRPATATEMIEIVGVVEDSIPLSIVGAKAMPAEVLDAFTWATADDQIGMELEHRPRGALARVYEILKREEPDQC
jgi:hypothetical protein